MRTLLLCLPGGGQTIDRNAFGGGSDYWNFTKMSGLNDLAYADDEQEVLVHFLQPRYRTWLPIHGLGDAQLEDIDAAIEYFLPDKVIGCGFSLGATELLHACQFIDFNGLVLCSGRCPPGFNADLIWGRMEVLIWVGEDEPRTDAWYRPWRATYESARDIRHALGWEHEVDLEVHSGGHRWPRQWNHRLTSFFGLPAYPYSDSSRP